MFIFMSEIMPNTSPDRKGNPRQLNRWRCQEGCRLNGLVMVDFDLSKNPSLSDPVKVWTDFEQNHAHWMDETSCPNCIYLAHVTPSGKGLRVVFRANPNCGNLFDNAQNMANAMNLVLDDSCKDASRASFAVTLQDILYLNDNIFDYENPDYDKAFGDFYRKDPNHHAQAKTVSDTTPIAVGESVEGIPEELLKLEYHGTRFSKIIDCWLVRNGGLPAEGDRHRTALQMAGDLRYICDNNPEKVYQVLHLARFVRVLHFKEGRDAEIRSLCNDACGQRSWRNIPKRVADVLQRAGVGSAEGPADSGRDRAAGEDLRQAYEEQWHRLQPLLSAPYDVAVGGFADHNKIGAVFAAGTMYCTLLTRCYYEHFDGQMTRLNPQTLLIGNPASGKSGVDRLDREIMAVMRAADEPGRQEEKRYKEEIRQRTATKQKDAAPKRPEPCIRYLPSLTSNAIFYRRLANAKEIQDGEVFPLHVYTFDSELDAATTASSGGTWITKQNFELKAFHNEFAGVDFANNDSENAVIQVFWNYVCTGTPISLYRKIRPNNVNNGLCSRIAMFRIESDKYKMIPYGSSKRNHERELKLKEWGYAFDRIKGELKIERLVKHVYNLCENAAQEAGENQDDVLDFLRKRNVFYAIWFTVPRMVARAIEAQRAARDKGEAKLDALEYLTVEDSDLDFAELMFDAVTYWQDHFCGKMLEDSWVDAERMEVQRPQQRRSRNMDVFEMLPDTFTTQNVQEMTQGTRQSASNQVDRWKKLGWVVALKKRGYYQKAGTGAGMLDDKKKES